MGQLSVAAELGRFGPDSRAERPFTDEEAAAYCRRLTHRHYENFTVASALLPRRLLPHFYAVYAYCRWADDLADEAGDPQRSLDLLDWWQDELERCYGGDAQHPVFVALGPTIREFEIPREPFLDLLSAFRQDQQVTRYATHAEVLAYCQHSASPVGRLVLYLGRCHDDKRVALSDSICTGLQLINFCQDVARDWQAGRIYLPAETLDRAGYDETMFTRRACNAAFRAALGDEVARAERYLHEGQSLVDRMPKELRLEVALFAAGGLAVARAIRRANYDVWRARPTLSKYSKLQLLVGCWWHTRKPAGRHQSSNVDGGNLNVKIASGSHFTGRESPK
jgi:squalene synthase HpnC